MNNGEEIINELLVDSLNKIIAVEKNALSKGPMNDLTIRELHAIEATGLNGGTMTEIAKKLGVTVGTLTMTINHLVQKEYVERMRDEGDRRIVKIVLKRKGVIAYKLHSRFHHVMIKKVLADINKEQVDVLIQALGALNYFVQETYEKF